MDDENKVVSIQDLCGKHRTIFNPQTRGELITEIANKSGYNEGFVRKKLTGMQDIETLRYIISVCTDAVATGKKKSWRHAFDVEVKVIWMQHQ